MLTYVGAFVKHTFCMISAKPRRSSCKSKPEIGLINRKSSVKAKGSGQEAAEDPAGAYSENFVPIVDMELLPPSQFSISRVFWLPGGPGSFVVADFLFFNFPEQFRVCIGFAFICSNSASVALVGVAFLWSLPKKNNCMVSRWYSLNF